MTKLEQAISDAKAGIARLSEDVKAYVNDKSNSLDDRWALFISSGLGEEYASIDHPFSETPKWKEWCRSAIEDSLFDYLSRGTVVTSEELAEQLQEYIGRDFELDGATYETREEKRNVTFTQEDFDEWRERTLQLFRKSFTFDW